MSYETPKAIGYVTVGAGFGILGAMGAIAIGVPALLVSIAAVPLGAGATAVINYTDRSHDKKEDLSASD